MKKIVRLKALVLVLVAMVVLFMGSGSFLKSDEKQSGDRLDECTLPATAAI